MQNIIWLYFIKKIIQKNIEKNLDCKWERQYLCRQLQPFIQLRNKQFSCLNDFSAIIHHLDRSL